MKKNQKLAYMALGALLALIISITAPVLAASVQRQITAHFNDIKIYVDGVLITPRDVNGNIVEPFISDGTTYLPVRAVGEAFGKTVEWDGSTWSIFIGPRPGAVQYLPDILPAYQSNDQHGYNYVEYSAFKSGGAERFRMGGVVYTNGFTFNGNGSWAVYNTNGQFTKLTGVLCHVDGHGGFTNENAVWQIWCDGVLVDEWPISNDMAPRNVSIDLRGVNQLKIQTAGVGRYDLRDIGLFGLGNPILE
jgi:hypothetical protein